LVFVGLVESIHCEVQTDSVYKQITFSLQKVSKAENFIILPHSTGRCWKIWRHCSQTTSSGNCHLPFEL